MFGPTTAAEGTPLADDAEPRNFLQTLIEHDLMDEFRLMIDPLVLGGGKRLFRDGGPRRVLRLVESQTTTTGAILATYASGEG